MPTGFTAEVADGKLTEFPDFVKRCARGMGALVMMRDEPHDAPFPERIKPDLEYRRTQLERSSADMAEVVGWDAETSEAKANSAYVQEMIGYLRGVRENRQTRARYTDMLTQVEAWEPPTEDHVGLKQFMAEQLTSSIEFDTGYYDDPESRRPQRMTGEEYRNHQLAHLARDVEHHTEYLFDEIDQADGRDDWVQQLSSSLEAWQPVEAPARYFP